MGELQFSLQGLPVLRQAEWLERFPALVQGITLRSADFDFNLGDGGTKPPGARDGWRHILKVTGIAAAARCRQVHGARVVHFQNSWGEGLQVLGDADALVTDRRDILLAVTVADCVPVFLLHEERPLIGLAHAGWRGTAAGVVEATVAGLGRLGAEPASLRAHLGPAICGRCYEVGPEVQTALGRAVQPGGRVDLRELIAERCAALGIPAARTTRSQLCTRCDGLQFYSYRGGDSDRRMCAFIGWTPR